MRVAKQVATCTAKRAAKRYAKLKRDAKPAEKRASERAAKRVGERAAKPAAKPEAKQTTKPTCRVHCFFDADFAYDGDSEIMINSQSQLKNAGVEKIGYLFHLDVRFQFAPPDVNRCTASCASAATSTLVDALALVSKYGIAT